MSIMGLCVLVVSSSLPSSPALNMRPYENTGAATAPRKPAKERPSADPVVPDAPAGRRPYGGVILGAGFPFTAGSTWFLGQVRFGLPITDLESRLRLEAAGALGYAWTTSRGAFSSTTTVHGFSLVPLARLRLLATDRLHVYSDFGVGVVHYRLALNIPALGRADGSSTGAAFRLHAGLEYAVTERLAVSFEPLNLLFQTASEGTFQFGSTTFSSSTGIGPQAGFLAGARLEL
jgi:hypothetical protein